MTQKALAQPTDRRRAGVTAPGKCYQVFDINDANYKQRPSAETHHPKNSSLLEQGVDWAVTT